MTQSIREASTAKAETLWTDFTEILALLPYKKDEDYRFVIVTNLTKVMKASFVH